MEDVARSANDDVYGDSAKDIETIEINHSSPASITAPLITYILVFCIWIVVVLIGYETNSSFEIDRE
tara:strand:- start:17925 stop:18125 length:201 start_codon:yes stop_codon:yes gene_type:complete